MEVSMDLILEVFQEAMLLILKLAGPLLAVSLLVGLVVSILQAATQVHEQTLTFVPKLAGIAITLLVLGPYMINSTADFMNRIMELIGAV